jgi:hypothetical protein
MIPDKQLIGFFLTGYSEVRGKAFRVVLHPDEVDRRGQAIDGLAAAEDGERLAIEHTLIEPFEGERADAQPFLAAFSNLEKDPSLVLPNYDVTVIVQAYAIPLGANWQQVGEGITRWFRDNVAQFPEGDTVQMVPGLRFPLQVRVEKTRLEDVPGYVFIARTIPPAGRGPVIQRALQRKLPKLLATPADRQILIVERRDASYGYAHLRTEIEEANKVARLDYPNEIWLATTLSWDNGGNLWFHEIWPDLRRTYFYISVKGGNVTVQVHRRNQLV